MGIVALIFAVVAFLSVVAIDIFQCEVRQAESGIRVPYERYHDD